MKQNLWNTYCYYIKSKYYFQIYRKRANTIEKTMSIILALISSASVASWAIWNQWAVAWAVIIGGSTLLNIIKSQLPYEKRISAMDYMLPKLINLISEMENYYNSLVIKEEKSITKAQINYDLKEFEKTYNDLRNTFALKNIPEPWSKKISDKAEKLAEEEINRKYNYIRYNFI